MKKIFPEKLRKGDMVRIIAPSRSLAIIPQEIRKIAQKRLIDLGLRVSFGKHIEEIDDFNSSSINLRIEDLHMAFADKEIKAILTVIGGFNNNQLLRYVDWELIKKNPKIFCGYSDITALNNAIYFKTGLITYSGPHFSSFGQKLYLDYTLDYFIKCLFSEDQFEIVLSSQWSDDLWWQDQTDRHPIDNKGWLVINEGEAEGTLLGANLCTFNLLQGTEFFPPMDDSVLFLEDDYESLPHTFDRDLQSLIHQPDFNKVKGIVIGRFQKKSKMNNHLLTKIIKSKKELDKILVIAEVDFGHTDPKITFPIGGKTKIKVNKNNSTIRILEH